MSLFRNMLTGASIFLCGGSRVKGIMRPSFSHPFPSYCCASLANGLRAYVVVSNRLGGGGVEFRIVCMFFYKNV